MSKDLGCRWNFLIRQKGEMKQGREDSSFSYFKDNEIHCLVREYIQNSMDFPETDDSIVRVEFSFGELRCDDYPNLIQALIPRLAACSEACRKFQGGKDPYHTSYLFLKGREHGTLGYLKVSDYNTEGMYYVDDEDVGSPFDSCLHNASGSFKKNRRSGGSHGQGKTVGFVNSPINAVYYSTMTAKTHETFGEGVIRLCNHKLLDESGEAQYYQADAFYNKGGSPNSGDDIPEIFRRDKPGTDAFVLGMEYSEDVEKQMKIALLRSFFPAIAHNHLVAIICGEEFKADNLEDKMREYFPEPRYGEFDLERSNQPQLVFNPRPYCFEIAMVDKHDENHIVYTTDDFPGKYPLLEKASLSVWKDDRIRAAKSRDTILYMRDKEMIIEVQRYNSSKGYYGIFSCEGKGNEGLRDMENVTHDKWSESELKGFDPEDVSKAKKTKKEVKDFVTECLSLIFPEERDEEKEILSLRRRRLGAFGNRDANHVDEDLLWPSTNVSSSIQGSKPRQSDFAIMETLRGGKKKGKKATGTYIPPEPPVSPEKEDKPTPPVDPPVDPPVVPPVDPPTDPPAPPVNPPDKPKEPSVDPSDGDSPGLYSEDKAKGKHMKEIRLDGRNKTLVPLHDGEYACKLIIKVPQDYYSCKLALNVQGVSGQIPLELKRVSDGCTINGPLSNEIVGFDLLAGKDNVIKFTPSDNVRIYSLVIKAYGC